jgi:hypothetical protein
MVTLHEGHRICVASALPHDEGHMEKKNKTAVGVLEFRGGYALTKSSTLEAIITGYRDGKLNKDTLRVFAARREKAALHAESKVDLARIVNSKAELEGVKRLRRGLIERAGETLDHVIKNSPRGTQRIKSVSRRALRAIAQGRLTCTESVVLLMYFSKRITQVKPLKRLEEGERYARFTYGELEELSGISKANISRAVASLKTKGWLSTVWVVKPNENQFGLLFVDGPLLTLIPAAAKTDRSKPSVSEVNKTATPPAQNSNTPLIKLPTLRKDDPKREIQKRKPGSFPQDFKSDWERIQERARQIRETLDEQAA